jgi:hypothetical protein
MGHSGSAVPDDGSEQVAIARAQEGGQQRLRLPIQERYSPIGIKREDALTDAVETFERSCSVKQAGTPCG